MTDTLADIVLTREELYDRVWSTPMQKLALEFGLSDVGLAKVCKRHKIPRPSRGYWAKLESGKKVQKFPLIQAKDASLSCIHFRLTTAREEPKEEPPLRGYIEAVRAAAQRRYGAIEDASEMGQWLKWAEEYLDSVDPFSDRQDLPTYSLTPNELDQLTRECEADWSDYSETFRPRNPR